MSIVNCYRLMSKSITIKLTEKIIDFYRSAKIDNNQIIHNNQYLSILINSCVEPLFYDEKQRKLLLLVLFLVDIYGTKVVFFSFFLLYDFFLHFIKTLILFFILLHLYGVAITRLAEGWTPLLWPGPTSSSSCIFTNSAEAEDCFCSCSMLLIIVNLLHAMTIEWLNKTIQTVVSLFG